MSLIKKIYILFLYPFITRFIKKERSYRFDGFRLTVLPGVFHPQFFFSTKFFYSFIKNLSLKNKECLDLGCGSGLLSLLMLRKRAEVTAVDIQKSAIATTQRNFEKNSSQFETHFSLIESDLFTALKPTKFDFILINPPYFFASIKSENDLPWFCGENGEYFQKLFLGLKDYIDSESEIYMVLADNCDIVRIRKMALVNTFHLELVLEKKIWWEKNYIFKITSIQD